MKSANTDELCLTYGARAASDNGIYQSPGEVHDEILVQLDFFAGVLHSEDGAVEVWGKLPSIINFITVPTPGKRHTCRPGQKSDLTLTAY